MREIKCLKLHIPENKRIIVVSDIHGGLDIFKRLLKRVNYQDDYLIILGDMVNRGKNSLKTIQYMMELSQKPNVYIIKGNHEEDLYNRNILQRDKIKMYAKSETSILYEMLDGNYCDKNEDEIYDYAVKKYPEIFSFIHDLPDMIETDKYIFVHAAYFKDNNIDSIIRTVNYKKYNFVSDKWVIVGHYPTANYPEKYFNCNPLVLKENKIVFVDGGNGVKAFGQINCFIIDDGFSFISDDNFPKKEVLNDQEESGDVAITYLDPYVEVIENMGELVKCHFHGKEILLESRLIFEENGKFNARNASNYFLPLKKGDIVSVVYQGETISQIKKDGIIGYAYNKNLGE